jgi:hypothetical protein
MNIQGTKKGWGIYPSILHVTQQHFFVVAYFNSAQILFLAYDDEACKSLSPK